MTGRGATSVRELLQEWLPRQRWFAAKGGSEPSLTLTGSLPLTDPDGTVTAEVHLVTADVNGLVATYQVPLAYHAAEQPELAGALVGPLEHPQRGHVLAYDAPHDPAFVNAWLALVAAQAEIRSVAGTLPALAAGVLEAGAVPPTPDRPSRVLSGEQSNTSIIVGGSIDGLVDGTANGSDDHIDDSDPVILKVFRVLQPGANPDVAVTSALTRAGCANVPRLTGWVDGEWIDPHGDRARGHLTSVSEYLSGSEDAWRMACVAIQSDQPFTAEAAQIGTATAAVHAALADALPTRPTTRSSMVELADHLVQRLDWALTAVPELAGHLDRAQAVIDRVRELTQLPRQQRIHGDLHLGQVLDAGDRGWILLDFEGEPLRPLAARNRLDFVHRDIAGMLRSFDYAARHNTLGLSRTDPQVHRAEAWVAESCGAFLDSYARASGSDPREMSTLLRALELDKALYEAVYESRNRPAWVEIPLSAVRRLLSHAAAA